MITDLIFYITHFITHTIDVLGYLGVALLMAIESAAIPLPSEIIMPFAGFLVESGRFSLMGLGLAGAVGSTIGSWVAYFIGYFGGRPLIQKYGHYVFLSQSELDLTERFFQKFGIVSTFLGRILPVIRTFISIPCGIGKVNFWEFTITAFVGSFIWSYFLAWLGLKLGQQWHSLETYFRKFDILIGILVVSLLGYWIYRHIKKPSIKG